MAAPATCFEQMQRRRREHEKRHEAIQACAEDFAVRVAGCDIHASDGTLRHRGRSAKVLVASTTSKWTTDDTAKVEAASAQRVVIAIVDGRIERQALELNLRADATCFVYDMDDVLIWSASFCNAAAARAARPTFPTSLPVFVTMSSSSTSSQ